MDGCKGDGMFTPNRTEPGSYTIELSSEILFMSEEGEISSLKLAFSDCFFATVRGQEVREM
jgi:hypothetical protein